MDSPQAKELRAKESHSTNNEQNVRLSASCARLTSLCVHVLLAVCPKPYCVFTTLDDNWRIGNIAPCTGAPTFRLTDTKKHTLSQNMCDKHLWFKNSGWLGIRFKCFYYLKNALNNVGQEYTKGFFNLLCSIVIS